MHFVGTSVLGHSGLGSALRRVDQDVDCSMRSLSTTTTGTGDQESGSLDHRLGCVAVRVSNLEVLTTDIAGPGSLSRVAEQIDALRQALDEERTQRQLAHSGLLRSVEALGLEDVAARVSNSVMQKFMDEIGLVSSEQNAKMEVMKVELDAGICG